MDLSSFNEKVDSTLSRIKNSITEARKITIDSQIDRCLAVLDKCLDKSGTLDFEPFPEVIAYFKTKGVLISIFNGDADDPYRVSIELCLPPSAPEPRSYQTPANPRNWSVLPGYQAPQYIAPLPYDRNQR